MTYKELSVLLQDLDDEQLDDIVTAVVDDECYPIVSFEMQTGSEGVIRDGSCYLLVE